MLATVVDTLPGGGLPPTGGGSTFNPGGNFYEQGLDYYDGATKVVASDPRVVAWQTAEFTNDSFLVRFQDWVDRSEAEATLAANVPGSSLLDWDDSMHSAWVELPAGSTRQDVLDVSHQFLSLSNTLYAEPNFVLHSRRIPNDNFFPQQWALNNTGQLIPDSSFPALNPYIGTIDADIDAVEAWDLTTGSPNTVIAILDTGYNRFEADMAPNFWVNPRETYNGIDDDGNGVIDDYHGYDSAMRDGEPQDDIQDGHGMQVASMAAMPGNDTTGMSGVSWNSKLMFVKVVDDGGNFTTGGIIGGIQYVTKMKSLYGINIVAANLSFGGPTFSFSQSDALRVLGSKDVLICTAVANQGFNHDTTFDSPTGYRVDQILTVTATNAFDEMIVPTPGFIPGGIPEFGYGAVSVDIAAPGIEVMSTGFRYLVGPFLYTNLYVNTGTSLATPTVAGAAALVESLAPYLTAMEVKQLLMNNVDKVPYLNNLNVSDGRLNVFKALDAIPKTTISGTIFQDANNDKLQSIGETGLGGWTVYLDLDNDGVFDTNEPSTVTATNTGTPGPATGTYTFDAWLDTGTYRVRQVLQAPYTQTTPVNNGPVVINVATRGQDFPNVNFGNRQQPGTIRGTKFLDLDADGTRDLDEPGIAGIMFYVDLNNSGGINVGEPAAFTDANGNFTIPNVQPGSYQVREILAGGYMPTLPTTLDANGLPDPVLDVVVTSNTTTTPPLLFGNQTAIDYGDLPETLPGIPNAYSTTIANGGPSHGILPGFMLGTKQDFETDGRPSITATGDDNFPTVVSDDEDGLVSINLVQGLPQGAITFQVTNSTSLKGYVQAWIDFNGNGSFADIGDQILTNYVPVNGTNTNVPFNIPAGSAPGITYARLRYSVDRNLGPNGHNRAGEVEDYQLTIFSNLPIARDDRFPEQLFPNPDPSYPNDPLIKQESANNELDVLRNDPLPTSGQLRIYAGDFPIGSNSQIENVVTVGQDVNGKDILLFTPRSVNPFTGDFTFTYRVYDPTKFNPAAPDLTLLSEPANVTVKVTAKDPRPVDNTYTMVRGTTLTLNGSESSTNANVLLNDVFTPSAPVRVDSVTQAADSLGNLIPGATVSVVAGNVVFTPPAGYTGTVQFNYTVTDDDVSTVNATAEVTVQVTDPPPPSTPIDLSKYLATLSLRVVDARGFVQGIDPGFHVDRGEVVYVEVYSEDIRPGGSDLDRGVEAAFLDLLYDKDLLSVNITDVDGDGDTEPDIDYVFDRNNPNEIPNYDLDPNAITNSPEGVINELGSARDRRSTGGPLGQGPKFVVRVGFDAIAAGTFRFVADPAEDATNRSQILLAAPLIQTVPVPLPDPNPVQARDDQVFLIPLLNTVTIVDPLAGPEFVNMSSTLDVNADLQVDAIDALIVINELNTHGTRMLRDFYMANEGVLPPQFFVDVNGDGQVTAFDALPVINWLNQNAGVLSAPEDTSGGEFVPLTASAGEAVEEPEAEETSSSRSVTPVVGSVSSTSSNSNVGASQRRVGRANSSQDDSALLFLTAVDQLMAAGSDYANPGSSSASEVPLTDWLQLGDQWTSSRVKRSSIRNR